MIVKLCEPFLAKYNIKRTCTIFYSTTNINISALLAREHQKKKKKKKSHQKMEKK